MNFDEVIVKESPGLCRCCLSEGCYKDLGTEYVWMNDTEVYADMLLDCFDISITQHNDGPNGPKRLICEVCITRLRDACNFKKQVIDSERKFIDMLGRGEFKPKVLVYQQPQLKAESVDQGADTDGHDVEFLEDIDFAGDEEVVKSEEPKPSTSDSDRKKLKRGRSKAVAEPAPPPKKPKVVTKKRLAKGGKSADAKPSDDAASKSSLSAIRRNRLQKQNATTILECSTVVPFKWHRHLYLCFFCHLNLPSMDTLKDHISKEHKNPNFKSAVDLLKRDEKVKIDISTIKCRICSLEIQDLNNLIDHLKAHKRVFNDNFGNGVIPYRFETGFQCGVCVESFQSFLKLNQHMNKHFGQYVCEQCGKSFLSSDRLRSHALTHGGGFHCSQCYQTFDSLIQRDNHDLTIHNKPKLLKCLHCPETFPNYVQRKQHHASAHNVEIPIFICPVCGKTFYVMSKMHIHLKEVHERERNFSCTVCDQKFFSKTHVAKHMVKHIGARVHQCGVCKKSYARKHTLTEHMRIHSNDKRFVCAVCSQSFVQCNSLKLHIKVHHSDK